MVPRLASQNGDDGTWNSSRVDVRKPVFVLGSRNPAVLSSLGQGGEQVLYSSEGNKKTPSGSTLLFSASSATAS